jgi:hypothetical protein
VNPPFPGDVVLQSDQFYFYRFSPASRWMGRQELPTFESAGWPGAPVFVVAVYNDERVPGSRGTRVMIVTERFMGDAYMDEMPECMTHEEAAVHMRMSGLD